MMVLAYLKSARRVEEWAFMSWIIEHAQLGLGWK